MNDRRQRGLGKGLGALIPSGPSSSSSTGRPIDVLFADRGPDAAKNRLSDALVPSRHDEATSPGQQVEPRLPGSARLLHHPGIRVVPSVVTTEQASDPLVGAEDAVAPPTEHGHLQPVPGASFAVLPIHQIVTNTRQPRTVFDEDALAELAESIRLMGVLQPVVVRPAADGFELIMGERRWRASQLAGLNEIPAIIRETDDADLLRDALVENLHRADLNPLEEAAAFDQLLNDFGCTHDQLATRLGCSRPHISNQLRLLKLPAPVQRRVAAGVLSSGHARALLGLADHANMERLAQRIVAEGLSVRATEEVVTLGDTERPRTTRTVSASAHRDALDQYATRVSEQLETRVKVDLGRRRGRMTVEFADLADLDRILTVMHLRTAPDQ